MNLPGPHFIPGHDYARAVRFPTPVAQRIYHTPGSSQTATTVPNHGGMPSLSPPQVPYVMRPNAGAAGTRQTGSGYHAIGGGPGPRAPWFPPQLNMNRPASRLQAAPGAAGPVVHQASGYSMPPADHVYHFLSSFLAGMNNYGY